MSHNFLQNQTLLFSGTPQNKIALTACEDTRSTGQEIGHGLQPYGSFKSTAPRTSVWNLPSHLIRPKVLAQCSAFEVEAVNTPTNPEPKAQKGLPQVTEGAPTQGHNPQTGEIKVLLQHSDLATPARKPHTNGASAGQRIKYASIAQNKAT